MFSAMKKRKQHVANKEEALLVSSTTSTNQLGENLGPFPTGVIEEILSRLPAKSIARFRCVSEDWRSILCRPDFTDLFLKMSSSRPRLLFTFQEEGKWSFFSSPQSLISDKSSSPVVVENHMHVPRDYPFGICVPVCGLLCTKDEWSLSKRKDARMMICNPSTGRFKLLPKVKTRRGRVMTFFGYDPVEKLYKVLCMTACEKPYIHRVEQHQVLTLGTGKLNWRMIKCSVSHYPHPQDNEICINGVLYYLAAKTGSWKTSMIVCFDVRSEKLTFIIDEAIEDLKPPSTLINYKGKLGVVHPSSLGIMNGSSTGFELWIIVDMEKHRCSRYIYIFPSLWKTLVAETDVLIVGITGTNEIVFSPCFLSNPFYIFCYNMERNSIRRIEIQGIGPVTGQLIYTFLNHTENLKLIM